MRIRNIIASVSKPWNYVLYLNSTKLAKYLPDSLVIRCQYRAEMGERLNLRNPQTFNEKLQWLKLNNRNKRYTLLVDKYEAKKIVGSLIGIEHIIPTYRVWNCEDDIDIDLLPNSFVLKTTHDSHSIIICKNKNEFDISKAKEKLRFSLKRNYYLYGREWPYKM